MRVLFIGGTGLISSACTELAVRRGFVQRDVELFGGKVRQYIFISSASAYQKPPLDYVITESTPLVNPRWQYSRDKAACEDLLMQEHRRGGFPFTVVRPSLTYGPSMIPLAVNSWSRPYTIIERMRAGRKVIVPGDGTSLWTVTWNGDFAKGFVGLLGNQRAIGHAFHITSDEVLTWDQLYTETARAAGAEPNLLHVASEFIIAFCPDQEGNLLGDKAVTAVFDNSKIKRFVPGFVATTTFAQGVRRALAWFEADPARCAVDEEANATWDRIIEAYESGLASAGA
ncbi:MAG: NAD-dependent dehydratase [Planctomycetes bacterium SM23_32]|nr:MAG: NAD-dependent dehydratase [Planctomycetes bacterium SM23_32]